MNLTCGRNPWKRASAEDVTFRAYLKDSRFLASILPISSELEHILRRIFECNPASRITLPELRELILDCEHFTAKPPKLPSTPPPMECDEVVYQPTPVYVQPFESPYQTPLTPPPSPPAVAISQPSVMYSYSSDAMEDSESDTDSDSDDGSVCSVASSVSSVSSYGDSANACPTNERIQVLSKSFRARPVEPWIKQHPFSTVKPAIQVC